MIVISKPHIIVLALKDLGHFTMMCGDGTNDVGALKVLAISNYLFKPLMSFRGSWSLSNLNLVDYFHISMSW